MDQENDKRYYRQYKWLKIYKCPINDNMNSSVFHYFSEDLPGYQKTSLKCSTKPSRKNIKMYYEIDDEPFQLHHRKKDQSAVIDFDYMQLQQQMPRNDIVVDRSAIINQSQWVKKYEPKNYMDLLTEEKINKDLLAWLQSWNSHVFNTPNPVFTEKKTTPSMFNGNRNYQKNPEIQKEGLKARNLILLAGPPGCGKTTLIRVIARHCKYEVEQINASDDRSANLLIDKIENIAGNETIRINKKPTLICLDEVDGAAETEASGFSKVLEYIQNGKKQTKKVIKGGKQFKTKQLPKPAYIKPLNTYQTYQNMYQKKQLVNLNRPIIFICNDPFVRGLKQLRSKAHVIYFTTLATDRVLKRLKQICTKQKIYIQSQVLSKICEICNNDIRSCIGILQLVVKQKKLSDRSPKQIINKMKLSFVRDNDATINQFMSNLINRKKIGQFSQSDIINIQRQVMEISNPQLMLETFYHNLINIKGIYRHHRSITKLYDDMIYSDVLTKTGFKYRNQLDRFHAIPYIHFALNYTSDEYKRIQFPSIFFQKLKIQKLNSEILEKIYDGLPIFVRIYFTKKNLIGDYLYSMFLGIQSLTTKQSDIGQSILRMVTYNLIFKKESDRHGYQGPIFYPEIDTILTIGKKKPDYILSNAAKLSMVENFQFYKQKKDLLNGLDLRETTESMLNQLNLQSRKKRRNNTEFGIQYKFQEGTGTKITQKMTIKDLF